MLIWGVHVHVGVGHRDQVIPVVSSLLNHFPHLQALSASSPMWSGTDTGYASNRAMMFQQLPTAGLPFQFETWEEYESFVDDHLRTGVIEYLNDIRWDVRPSPALGTVEVRICDGVLEPARAGRAHRPDALPGRRPHRPADRGRDAADDAAVARAGEQVALGALRPRRRDHPRRRRATSGWSPTTSPTCSPGSSPSRRGSAAWTSSAPSTRSRAAGRRTSGSGGSPRRTGGDLVAVVDSVVRELDLG